MLVGVGRKRKLLSRSAKTKKLAERIIVVGVDRRRKLLSRPARAKGLADRIIVYVRGANTVGRRFATAARLQTLKRGQTAVKRLAQSSYESDKAAVYEYYDPDIGLKQSLRTLRGLHRRRVEAAITIG